MSFATNFFGKTFTRNTWVGGNTNTPGVRVRALSSDWRLRPSDASNVMFYTGMTPLCAVYANNSFIVTGTNYGGGVRNATTIAATSDATGQTFTDRTISSAIYTGMVNHNGTLVTISTTTQGATSVNYGVTWTSRVLPAGNMFCPVYAPSAGFTLAFTTTTNYYTTPDGITWTLRSLPAGSVYIHASAASPTAVLTTGYNSTGGLNYRVNRSTDGINWTQSTVRMAAGYPDISAQQAVAGNRYTFFPVGLAWNGSVFCLASAPRDFAYGPNSQVDEFQFFTSADGLDFIYSGSARVHHNVFTFRAQDATGYDRMPYAAFHSSQFQGYNTNIMTAMGTKFVLPITLQMPGGSSPPSFVTAFSSVDNGVNWQMHDLQMVTNATSAVPVLGQSAADPTGGLVITYQPDVTVVNNISYHWLQANIQAKEIVHGV